ncbi:MAG: NAD-dependent succinate-semialdehyde dehydrogenase [Balneolaceae bacterium]|nr:NAD-dependent succinate-semialdehyde dehydrogenase [Balneolaceae bacterium]
MIQSVNPATGDTIEQYEAMSDGEIRTLVRDASEAQKRWGRTDFEHRAGVMREAARLLRGRSGELAELMAREMGKPLAQGVSEAEKCAWVCEYYADKAGEFLADEPLEADGGRSYLAFRPMGTVLAIMPWNFPFWQLFRFAAPALMAGNGALLKHAENVTRCALRIESLLHQAGVPGDLFRTVVAEVNQVQDIIENPGIAAVTLTGSTRAGKAVASQAGATLKKTVLELGGSDPYLVLEDADLEMAAETCVTSRMINSGQSCIAAKRFIAVSSVFDAFSELVVEKMNAQKTGDPFDEETDVGPMAREDLRVNLHRQVRVSREEGARCLLGGHLPEGRGWFYPPTVLTDVEPGMPAWEEELFGPVASLIRAGSEEEAVEIANDTSYGLGAAVFSRDTARAEEIAANRLEAGCCFVNSFVASDPRQPFGGVKESGYGRELSREGIREFVNRKTVFVSQQ